MTVNDQTPRYQLLDSNGNKVGTLYIDANGSVAIQEGTNQNELRLESDGAIETGSPLTLREATNQNELTLASDGTVGVPALDTDEVESKTQHIAPTTPNFGERAIHNPPDTVQNKTEILAPGDTTWTTNDIAWAGIFPASEYLTNPLGDWYMYYAEDHVSTAKIGLAYADNLHGPWTDYASNPVFSAYTNQETPSPIWDPVNSRLNLYYHSSNLGTTQSTGLATSTDGLSFTDQGLVIDAPRNTSGDDQTGYFRPFRLGGEWFGYHLIGGTDNPETALSYSTDGVNWMTDPRPLGYHTDVTGDNNRRLEWNMSQLYNYNGQLWWFGATSPFTSGSTYGEKYLAAAPAYNERKLAREPTIIGQPTETNEGTGLVYPDYVPDGTTLRVAYTSGGRLWMADVTGGVY